MKSVFEALYDGDIDERNKKKNLPKDDPEFAAYEKLEATLNEEQKKLLEKFLEKYAENENRFRQESYERGVKVGINLGTRRRITIPKTKNSCKKSVFSGRFRWALSVVYGIV